MDAVSAVVPAMNPVLFQIAALQGALQNQQKAAEELAKNMNRVGSDGVSAAGRIDTYA